ncbi:glycosyltransferase family 4 protein [Xanthomarina gelatinilytica]|uniref:glycosyltransferase family 4 protein n=1 Tax=Xanthomarina gelatinilytica TaxID=1137281 RepID=UPI003AA8B6EB
MSLKKPVKVIQLFDHYPVFYQPYIPPVIEALSNTQDLDLKIMAFNGQQSKVVEIIPSYYKRKFEEKIYQLLHRSNPKLNLAEIRILRSNIDIVHLQHSYLFPKIIGLLNLPENPRPKIVITLRGGDTYVKPWLDKKWIDFYKTYGNKIDAFITMSKHQKDYLHTKWDIEKERIHVVPISFGDTEEVLPKHPNENVLNIISAFRMCWEKNIDGNLRVVKILKEKGIPVKYDIYGDGADVGQVYYLIDKYNLSDCVSYYGKIDNKTLKSLLPNFDFYLQLSHSESLGITVVEAQSAGTPSIVSNTDGLPESIINGRTGFCVDSYDVEKAAAHMLHLWKHPEEYYLFSKEAIMFVKSKFTISNEVNKLTKLYLNLSK